MSGRDRLNCYKKSGKTEKNRREERVSRHQQQRAAFRENAIARRRGMDIEEENIQQRPVRVPPNVRLEVWKKQKEQKLLEMKKNTKPAFKFCAVKYDDTYLYKPPGESTKFKPPKTVKPVSVPRSTSRKLRSGKIFQSKPQVPTVQQAVNEFAAALQSIPEEDTANSSIHNRTFEIESEVKTEPLAEPSTSNVDCEELPRPESAAITNIEAQQTAMQLDQHMGVNLEGTAVTTVELEERSAEFFRSLHKRTCEKLEELSDKWESIEKGDIPGSVCDLIDVATGYARLLVKEKLQQFSDLIRDHLNNTQPPVLLEDLEGFWGLVDIQVQNIYKSFADLDEVKNNNWKEPQPVHLVAAQKGKGLKQKSVANNARSKAREFIALARKQMKPSSVSSPKPMSPAVMKVSAMAKTVASPKSSVRSKTPLVHHKTSKQKTSKENIEPVLGKTPGRLENQTPKDFSAALSSSNNEALGSVFTPLRAVQVSEPRSAIRRSSRLMKTNKISDLITWDTP